MQGHHACVQIGTHGSLTKAELEEIASGGISPCIPRGCLLSTAQISVHTRPTSFAVICIPKESVGMHVLIV